MEIGFSPFPEYLNNPFFFTTIFFQLSISFTDIIANSLFQISCISFAELIILLQEKELKRLQDEAEKEERRREKEEAEMMKQLKRQQEEAEKDQRRREKEEAELKKQLAIQKQATIMERFLKSKKNNSPCQDDQSLKQAMPSDSSRKRDEEMFNAVTLPMDCALSLKDEINAAELLK